MGWREAGWVADNSPYKHDARLVHLILAENADKARDYELPDNRREVARKAAVSMRTVTAVFATMVEDGYLEIVEAPAGKAIKYRFMIPTLAESARGEEPDPSKMARPTLAKSAPTLAKCGIGLFSNDIQTKSYKTTARSPLEQRFRNWWEVQDPKPTTPYIGGKKILEKLVAAGWTENEVISALDAARQSRRVALRSHSSGAGTVMVTSRQTRVLTPSTARPSVLATPRSTGRRPAAGSYDRHSHPAIQPRR